MCVETDAFDEWDKTQHINIMKQFSLQLKKEMPFLNLSF